jgi:hypothetical protein
MLHRVLLACSLAACAGSVGDVPDTMSARGLRLDPTGGPVAGEGVVPFDVQSPLCADGAVKARAIRLPAGKSARYVESGVFELPVGTTLLKSFGRASRDGRTRWLETRLLVREGAGWRGYVYAWDASQRERRVPRRRGEDAADRDSRRAAEPRGHRRRPRGRSARALDLARPAERRAARRADPARAFVAGSCERRRRGSCARLPGRKLRSLPRRARTRASDGPAARRHVTSPLDLGICRPTGNEGRSRYDVSPGHPEDSYLQRLASKQPGEMMPPLGRSTVDDAGLALLTAWIAEMNDRCP